MKAAAIAAVSLLMASPAFSGRYLNRAVKSGDSVSSRRAAVRNALPAVPKVEGAPVAERAPGPVPANLPHNLGLKGSYHSRKPAPPPPASELKPLPSIQQEFLERVAAKHAASDAPVKVKAAKAGTIGNFDPDRDTEVIVLGGDTPALIPAPESSGTHNRDQGGKPVGKKEAPAK